MNRNVILNVNNMEHVTWTSKFTTLAQGLTIGLILTSVKSQVKVQGLYSTSVQSQV